MTIDVDLSGDFLGRLVELGYEQAERVILGLNQKLLSAFLIIHPDGETEIIGTPWEDELQKQVMLHAISGKLKKTRAVAYSFVAEAWASTQPIDWHPGKPHVPASKAPNRVEKVMCFAVAADGRKDFGSWNIERDENGKALALIADKEGTIVEGQIVSLFER